MEAATWPEQDAFKSCSRQLHILPAGSTRQDIDSLLDASLDVLLQQLLLGHEVRVHDCYIAW